MLLLVFMAAAAAAVTPADAAEATLSGRVRDDNGGGLPGVTVEARCGGAGATVAIGSTDREGAFQMSASGPAPCEVAFRMPGFATVRRTDVLPGTRGGVLDVAMHVAVTADVVVHGRRTFRNLAEVESPEASLLGVANASSDGAVTAAQIDERPILRPGEILETVPGLVISQHSGEGKANQYYLRGFNLDHGTDFATSVAGVPVNLPSHAHGQGYSDLNFVIPELVSGVQYRKGLYAAEQGDFSTAGSANVQYASSLDEPIARVSGGSYGYGRALFAQSPKVGEGTLLYAIEAVRNDGPWVHGDAMRKYNGVLRWSLPSNDGDGALAVTAMAYANTWNSTDQVPDRAIAAGLPRYGAIDPTDGGDTHRYGLSLDWQRRGADSLTTVTAYAVDYGLDLFSNFTYFLNDPVHGDQFEQVDRRVVTGLNANHRFLSSFFGLPAETTVGLQLRNDNIAEDGLYATEARQRLSVTRLDHVAQTSGSLYAETSVELAPKLRAIAGLRGDLYRFRVASNDAANSGTDTVSLASPKLSLVAGPWSSTELYANYGWGFHSNDARGATITVDPKTGDPADRVTPLARAKGGEVGLRSVLLPGLQTTLSLWRLDIASELVFAGDAGTTEPSRPSRRVGIEWASFYRPLPGVTVDADLAVSRARFSDSDPAGSYIPGAVETVVSAGAALDPRGGFFGGVRLRYFGPRPLIEDGSVRSRSSTLVNLQAGYEIAKGLRLGVDVFNVLDARVSDVDYYYASRLPNEPAGGIEDIHTHPAEPRSARMFVAYAF
jgi:outer membrane receptor protein involved in Fe transport